MTSALPLIILFTPAAEIAREINTVTSKLSLPSSACHGIEQIPSIIQQYPQHIPVICMPLALSDKRSGINETLQIRGHPTLRSIKILGLLTLYDKISLHSFFSAGADVVLQPPFDYDQMSLQLYALAKMSAEFDALSVQSDQVREVTRATMRFLDTTRDGVVIVDENSDLIVANRAAERILALNSEDTSTSFAAIAQQFRSYLDHHREQESAEESIAQIVSSAETTFKKADGGIARLLIRIMSLQGSHQKRIGFAIGIGDLSIPRQIASKLSKQDRVRTLSLTLAATALETLGSTSLGIPGHPLRLAEQRLLQSTSHTPLSQVMTALLELIDITLPPNAEIRVALRADATIFASQPDLFQLLGALLFFATDRAGADGETAIESSFDATHDSIAVIFSYTANELVEPISGDYLLSLVQGDHERFTDKPAGEIHTLKFAQTIAKRLGIVIEAKSNSRWAGKVRVLLPCEITTDSEDQT